MSGGENTVFYMYSGKRDALIAEHQFFVEQAKVRLLEQFTDLSMESEAQAVSDEAWAALGQAFDPDRHDPGDFAELAQERGYEHYRLLSGMREHVRLSMVAAFFHSFEKSLKDWIAAEIKHLTRSKAVKDRIWSATMDELYTLLKHGGCNVFVTNFYKALRCCQLVVNAYKHGEGKSLEELRNLAPQFFVPDDSSGFYKSFPIEFFDHTYLKIEDEDFDRFSEAIVQFWQGVPDYMRVKDFKGFPKWLDDAVAGRSER